VKEKPKEQAKEEISPEKKAVIEAREKGNALYKKKEFDNAIMEYDRALSIEPDNFNIILNKAAAYFEKNESDKCIELCKNVVEEGRSKKADFQLIAKAFSRMGNAYLKQERYEEAIEAYDKSLTEHNNPDVGKQKKKAEKLKKEKDEKLYLDPEKSKVEKDKGNEFFKHQKFPEAIAAYTEAIRRNPQDAVLYSNRAAAYTKLGEFQLGLNDCEEALKRDSKFVKAFIRKAHLETVMKQYHKALATYDEALKIDPENQEVKDGINRVIELVNQSQEEASQGKVDEERIRRARSDPEIQSILADPQMREVLNELQQNPGASQHYLKDPQILKNIQKLISAGILQVK